MNPSKNSEGNKWVVVTFSRPITFMRTPDEAYALNPVRRYVMTEDNLDTLRDHVQTMSDLKGSTYYTPLDLNRPVNGVSIMVERNRHRGIGDLLFLTGPLSYIRHLSATTAGVDMYGLTDRGLVLQASQLLRHGGVLCGMTHYDDLAHYNYHWFVDTVTESNEEPDQLNVYDALYKDLGLDPATIPAKFKRPSVRITDSDYLNLDHFFKVTWEATTIDLRRTPYYVVCPFAAATLRTLPYGHWLEIIGELSARRPVVVLGHLNDRIPFSDMSAGDFASRLSSVPNVINALGATGLRTMMGVIDRAACFVGLDSGPLYIAQACRTPAISIWGAHDPGVRIGYDPDYMDLAVWNQPACPKAPCYAYAEFPAHKCPRGADQQVCDVLVSVKTQDVMAQMDKVESKS